MDLQLVTIGGHADIADRHPESVGSRFP